MNWTMDQSPIQYVTASQYLLTLNIMNLCCSHFVANVCCLASGFVSNIITIFFIVVTLATLLPKCLRPQVSIKDHMGHTTWCDRSSPLLCFPVGLMTRGQEPNLPLKCVRALKRLYHLGHCKLQSTQYNIFWYTDTVIHEKTNDMETGLSHPKMVQCDEHVWQ